MGYQAYADYKESGVEWFRAIPSDWTVHRLKMVASEPLKYGANEAADLEDPSLPRFIRITDVNNDGSLNPDTFRSLPEKTAAPYLLEDGDILLARSGATVGKSFIYSPEWGKAAYAGYLIRLRTDKHILHKRFAYYFFQSSPYWANINSELIQATIQNFSAEKYSTICIPTPDFNDQVVITQFLDHKTAQIDRLIDKKKELIEKLQEQRTTVITHAVTKGLDSNSALKTTRTLGNIPTHWGEHPIKFGLSIPISDGPHETPEILSEGIPFLSAEAVKDDALDFEKKRGFISLENHKRYSKKYKPLLGDIYMVKSGATTGNIARVETTEEFNIWSPLAALRPNKNIVTSDFIFYFMKSEPFNRSVELGWNYGTQQNIGMNVISNLRIAVPPIPEQESINAYLKSKTTQIDAMLIKTEDAIERLQEYRTALITAAVTGQIDVRATDIKE
jgi:type I restriction enzyme S subunit